MYGDLAFSLVNTNDSKTYEIGFCFRPIAEDYETNPSGSAFFDCLDARFFFKFDEIDDVNAPGYTQAFTIFDLFAPKLDTSHLLPSDLTEKYLDSDLVEATVKSGNWILNAGKSYKKCSTPTTCTFNVSFERDFEVNAESDYMITKDLHQAYQAYTYAVEYENFDG